VINLARRRGRRGSRWIQKAIKRPGRVRKHMMRKYGKKAFTKDGDIKVSYINKELKRIKKSGGGVHGRERSLYSALTLAKRLKKMGRRKRRK